VALTAIDPPTLTDRAIGHPLASKKLRQGRLAGPPTSEPPREFGFFRLLLCFFLFLTLLGLFAPTNPEDIVQQVFLLLLHLLAICIPFDWHYALLRSLIRVESLRSSPKIFWCCIARYISNASRRSLIKYRSKQVLQQYLASTLIGANSRPQYVQLISG